MMRIPVVVVWADSWNGNTAEDKTEIDHRKQKYGPHITYTIGWLVRADYLGVTLSADLYHQEHLETQDDAHSLVFVPRGVIIEMLFLDFEPGHDLNVSYSAYINVLADQHLKQNDGY